MYGFSVRHFSHISTGKAPVVKDRRAGHSCLPELQRDSLNLIRNYVAVDNDAVSVSVESDGAHEILELNIVLPE